MTDTNGIENLETYTLEKSLLRESDLRKGLYSLGWADRFMGSPFEADALQCVKDQIECSKRRDAELSKYRKTWRQTDAMDPVERAKYHKMMDEKRSKFDKEEDAVEGKKATLESKYLDWRIAQAKNVQKSEGDAPEEEETLMKSEGCAKCATMEKGDLTPEKARKILHDKQVHGHPLTDQQRKFFGAVSSGTARKSMTEGLESLDDYLEKATPIGGITPKGYKKVGKDKYVKVGGTGKTRTHAQMTLEVEGKKLETVARNSKMGTPESVAAYTKLAEHRRKEGEDGPADFIMNHYVKPYQSGGGGKEGEVGKIAEKIAPKAPTGGGDQGGGGGEKPAGGGESKAATIKLKAKNGKPYSVSLGDPMYGSQESLISATKGWWKEDHQAAAKAHRALAQEKGETAGTKHRHLANAHTSMAKWLDDRAKHPGTSAADSPFQTSSHLDKFHKLGKSMEGIMNLEEYLEKSGGLPSHGVGLGHAKSSSVEGGSADGGELENTGRTSGSSDSASGPGQDAQGQITGTGVKGETLSEDDAKDEAQMKPHKKPIERTAKSMTPAAIRDMTSHEHAAYVSQLKKSEESDDVVVGGPAHPYLQKSMETDLAAEAMLKSEEFYQHGREPRMSHPESIIKQSVMCKSGHSHPAFLTACPQCGDNTVASRPVPGAPMTAGQHRVTPNAGHGSLLHKAREEEDVVIGGSVPDAYSNIG